MIFPAALQLRPGERLLLGQAGVATALGGGSVIDRPPLGDIASGGRHRLDLQPRLPPGGCVAERADPVAGERQNSLGSRSTIHVQLATWLGAWRSVRLTPVRRDSFAGPIPTKRSAARMSLSK